MCFIWFSLLGDQVHLLSCIRKRWSSTIQIECPFLSSRPLSRTAELRDLSISLGQVTHCCLSPGLISRGAANKAHLITERVKHIDFLWFQPENDHKCLAKPINDLLHWTNNTFEQHSWIVLRRKCWSWDVLEKITWRKIYLWRTHFRGLYAKLDSKHSRFYDSSLSKVPSYDKPTFVAFEMVVTIKEFARKLRCGQPGCCQ